MATIQQDPLIAGLGTAQTPEQMASKGAITGAGSLDPTINSSNLNGGAAINVPSYPTDNNNYGGYVAGGNATIGANGVTMAPQVTDGSIPSYLKDALNAPPPPSASSTYATDYANSGITQKQDAFNVDNTAYTNAKGEFDAVNAKLQGLTAEATAIPIQQQQDSTGRGITAAGLAPITTASLRENALKALPLQAQALAAQAKVAAAQGKAALSQNILQQAQDHLDTIFKIHQQDATNLYNYQTDLRNKIYDIASTQEKAKLDAQQKKADQAYQTQQDNRKYAQNLASTAITNGQASVATKILALDPTSSTYLADVGKYAAQMSQKPDVQFVPGTDNQSAGYFDNNTKVFTPIGGGGRPNNGGAVTLTGKPQNATQSAANGYADRLNQSNIVLDTLGSKFSGALAYGNLLPNALQSADRQAYEQAKRNFVTSILRRESGAAISATEFATEDQKYFPQAGDKPETIVQKANARNTAINNVYREANVARPVLPGQIIESEGVKYRVSSDGVTLEKL